jgi:type IV pilus assembly protein PilQ
MSRKFEARPQVNPQESRMMKKWKTRAALFVLSAMPLSGWADPVIQSITSNSQAGADVIRVEFNEPIGKVPTGFVVQTPPRIALDLPGVTSALDRNIVDVNAGNLRSVNVAKALDRTRLVLNLRHSAKYQAKIEGNTLLIIMDSTASTTPSSVATATPPVTASAPVAASGATAAASPQNAQEVHFADSQNASPLALKGIDFRRGADAAGRIVVDLPNDQVGVDIKQQGHALVVEFLKSTLPESLRRRWDVTDFGTPVNKMSAVQVGDRVRLTVEPKGNWEHSAYQSDNQFVLEVKPQQIDPNKLTKGPGYVGEKLSLNFQSIEIRSLLQVIADFTDFNVVTSDTVSGTVTLRLKDVPWDQALDIILQAKALGLRKSGNVIWIAPKDEIAAKEKSDLEAKAQIQQLEPLRTQNFQLNYAKAADVADAISGTSSIGGTNGNNTSRILSPRGSGIADARTNQVIVSDTPSKLEEIQLLIAKIDVPVRQVMIEARIVEADDTFGKSLGVRLGSSDLRGVRGGTPGWGSSNGNRIAIGGNYTGIGDATLQGSGGSDGVFNNSTFVNMPATGIAGNAGTIALSLFGSSSNRFLNLELSALEADGKGKIVSSPRVITADQIKALIEQGTEYPYQTATSSGATAIAFRKANLKLEVRPQITPEGGIILDVDINKDSRGETTAAGIAINTKHVQTQVLVENGGTVVIGGIFFQEERSDTTKVPMLGDIPFLGALFRSTTKTNDRREMLVFLTPKVVTEQSMNR